MTTQTPDFGTAAKAFINRGKTPLWKDVPATAGYIAALRDALAADHTEHHLENVGPLVHGQPGRHGDAVH